MRETEVKQYLMTFPEVVEDFPFGPEAAVYKIADKMFAIISHGRWKEFDSVARLNLKCDPDEALMLRDMFEEVIPGYHMNKKHWNTVILNGSVPDERIKSMVNSSFSLVVNKLGRPVKHGLVLRHGEGQIHR